MSVCVTQFYYPSCVVDVKGRVGAYLVKSHVPTCRIIFFFYIYIYCLETVRLIRAAGGAMWLCIHSSEVSHDIWNMLHAWNLTLGNMIPALRKTATWVDFNTSSTCRLTRLAWLNCGCVYCLASSLQCWPGLGHFWFCPCSVADPHIPAHCPPTVGLHHGIKCVVLSFRLSQA